jgi:hypothetical protein
MPVVPSGIVAVMLAIGDWWLTFMSDPSPSRPGAPTQYSAATMLLLPVATSLAVPASAVPLGEAGDRVRSLTVGPVLSMAMLVEAKVPQLPRASWPLT